MNTPEIAVHQEVFPAQINGRDINVPLIHALPPSNGNEQAPIYFTSGFGNTVPASIVTARFVSKETGRPVVIVPPQGAHTTMTFPRTQITDTYRPINEIAKGYIDNTFGSDADTTVMGLSHGSLVGSIYLNQFGPHDLSLLAPMGGDLADVHDQETLERLAKIQDFDERWRVSMEEASPLARWRLLARFLLASSRETSDMVRKGEYDNLVKGGTGVWAEFKDNARWAWNPEVPPEVPRNSLVVMDAFHGGATTDFRPEASLAIRNGKKVLIACGEKDPMYDIETVTETLRSDPSLDTSSPDLHVFEVPGIIHPYATRKKAVGLMVAETMKRMNK